MTYKSLLLLLSATFMSAHGAERDTLLLNEFTLTHYVKSETVNTTVVTDAEIERSAESSLLPVIENIVPGVFVSERGLAGYGISTGSAGVLNIRGVGQGNKVLFMIDGQPQWAGVYGHSLADVYAAAGVERVDVVKGAASLMYGSGAMGGAINIVTKRAAKDGLYGSARAMVGSYSTQKFSLSAGARSGGLQVNAAAQLDRSDGNRANSAFWSASEYANVEYAINKRFDVGVGVDFVQAKSDYPGTEQHPLIDMWTQMHRGTEWAYVRNTFANSEGGIRIYVNHGRHKISDGYAADAEPVDSVFIATDYNWGLTFTQTFHAWSGGDITGGISYQQWGGQAGDEIERSENESGAYVLVQQSLFDERLCLNGGVRMQQSSSYGKMAVPQAGFLVRPCCDAYARFAFGKGFRTPNIRELYIGTAANPELRAEYLYNYELELCKQFDNQRFEVGVSLFFIDARNIIQTAYVDGRAHNENVGKFRNKGIEASVRWKPSSLLSISANYSYLHTTANGLLYAPKNMLNGAVILSPGRLSLTLQSHAVWRLNTGGSITNYCLFDARVAYDAPVMPFVKLDNITNRNYQIIYGCPMPGTTVMGGLQIKI